MPELQKTADVLYKSGYMSHYQPDYYLLPLDERGLPDLTREGAEDYLSPMPEYLHMGEDEGWTSYGMYKSPGKHTSSYI